MPLELLARTAGKDYVEIKEKKLSRFEVELTLSTDRNNGSYLATDLRSIFSLLKVLQSKLRRFFG